MCKLQINSDACKGCGLCIGACPKNILEFGSQNNTGGYNYVMITDEKECISCCCCAITCPEAAISVYKED